MKKIVLLAVMVAFGVTSNAQTKAKKAVTPGPTKKDGTPDMRFKSNKTAKKN